MDTIPSEIIKIALMHTQGADFENFANNFMSVVEGRSFIPLGGVHDGGADGFLGTELVESEKAEHFYQFSIQEDYRGKIKKTVTRLKGVGREPQVVTYVTSRLIPHIDQEEDTLSNELAVRIRIRDSRYISSHINDSLGTIAAFQNHLARYTEFLKQIGRAKPFSKINVADPSVYVFLQQEVESRLGNSELLKTITDGLILWALNDTNPETESFLTRDQILQKILDAVPWSKHFIKAELNNRLNLLAIKGNATGREVRWYKKEDKYCLPFETRQLIEQENTVDETLRIEVYEEILLLAAEKCSVDRVDSSVVTKIVLRTIECYFEKEGLQFSYLISRSDIVRSKLNTISDRIDDALNDIAVPFSDRIDYHEITRDILTIIFYNSSEKQRYFLYHLSRTYILLFSLQADPKLIEYFQRMTANFKLYIGSDVLILALSERYLKQSDQMTRNMLRMAADAKAEMYLTEPVLQEVYTHLQATNYEFSDFFAEIEPYVNRTLARNCSKILIRAYFYAKERSQVNGWKSYIGQFVTYKNIWNNQGEGIEELRIYLMTEFNLKFKTKSDLESLVDVKKVNKLSAYLLEQGEKKDNQELAYNDALMVYGVYGMRSKNGEIAVVNEFGLQTWWLTQETRIQKFTVELARNSGAKYIMRPEFLLNYFALSPSAAEVVKSYKNIFPTVMGLQMGHRLREDVYRKILSKVNDCKEMEVGRLTAMVNRLSDALKTDQMKIYSGNLNSLDKILTE